MKTHKMASDTLIYSLITTDADKNLVIRSNFIVVCITISYIMFTKVIGPNVMKNRKPMDLQFTMLFYNFFLVACNAYLAAQAITIAVDMWSYRCNFKESPAYKEIDEIGRPSPVVDTLPKYSTTALLSLLVKFLELFDTVIFILRKKMQQVSFLHVYHHAIVFFLLWVALKLRLVGYYIVLLGAINFSVHVVLYLYYALSALGPGVRKYLWWKKYLTTIQIVQFFVVMLYMVYSGVTGCDKYSNFDVLCFIGVASVAALFINFYMRTYNTTKKSS